MADAVLGFIILLVIFACFSFSLAYFANKFSGLSR